MSAPTANTQVLPFSERVKLVGEEITKRINQAKPNHKAALQARLWTRWLNREVLA